MEHTKPFLTETINKYLIKKSLREVRNFKNYYFTILINITLCIVFIGSIALILYYRYKGKLTPEEKAIKEKLKKQYLFEKLHKISYEKSKEHKNLITDLPVI
jgi:hypothetical protein